MFDPDKRTTLKLLAGTTVAATLPVLSGAAGAALPVSRTALQKGIANSADPCLTLSFSNTLHAGSQLVSLTNNTSKSLKLSRIYPACVRADGQCYDLNRLLENGDIVLEPGQSRVARLSSVDPARIDSTVQPITATSDTAVAVQVATISEGYGPARVVNTIRTMC